MQSMRAGAVPGAGTGAAGQKGGGEPAGAGTQWGAAAGGRAAPSHGGEHVPPAL